MEGVAESRVLPKATKASRKVNKESKLRTRTGWGEVDKEEGSEGDWPNEEDGDEKML